MKTVKRITMIATALLFVSMSVFGADWSKPALTDSYSNFLLYMNSKVNDSALWLDSIKTTATNVPANAKRYNAATNSFQRYSANTWVPMKTNIVGDVVGDVVGNVTGNVTGNITGDANTLDGQHGSYYVNASNLSSGIVPLAQIPATLTGKDADTLDGLHGSAYAPPGMVIYMAASTCPSGYLPANGAAVARSTYSTLFSAIGTTFGIGNGSTTFNVPDLRGEFLRSWSNGSSTDSGRAFGSWQADDFKSHTHSRPDTPLAAYGLTYGAATGYLFSVSGGTNTGATGGAETRPRNVALLTCIHI